MSSEQAMRGALQKQLLTLGWDLTRTAMEGRAFSPVATQAYQEVTTQFFEPDAITLAGSDNARGVFQVRILWPLAATTGDIGVTAKGIGGPTARAEAIKAGFPRNLTLPTSDGGKVKIMRVAHISRGPVQGDRDVTIVRIRFGDR